MEWLPDSLADFGLLLLRVLLVCLYLGTPLIVLADAERRNIRFIPAAVLFVSSFIGWPWIPLLYWFSLRRLPHSVGSTSRVYRLVFGDGRAKSFDKQ